MITDTLTAALEKHPFVEELGPEHVARLKTLARKVQFEPDQVIFREGDERADFYLVVSGRVALEMSAPDHTFRIQTLAAGDEVGWSSMLMGRGKYFQARALEPVEALAFDGGQLLAACREDPSFGYALMSRMLGIVSERLEVTRLQLLDMHSPVAKKAGT